MNTAGVQGLILRAPHGPAVAHLVLRIPRADGAGRAAARLLREARPCFGPRSPNDPFRSVGFSHAGLERLGLPADYLRVFLRLAPAFREGAVQRSVRLGDTGANSATHWAPEFAPDAAHVLLSWHGPTRQVGADARAFAERWVGRFGGAPPACHLGHRLGAPPGQRGEWVHFGMRDGISEVCIDRDFPPSIAPDGRRHAPGALLLGHVNDAGSNPGALAQAPEKVRAFFHDSSFGVLRPMRQDVRAFRDQVQRWVDELTRAGAGPVSADEVKAKLCGRWPSGEPVRPGERAPSGSLVLDLADDARGEGCPFGSHVRRMRAAPDAGGFVLERPLQRRSFPFGPAEWSADAAADFDRGQIGHFFCASLEAQFEHLLGQWAARPPLGFDLDDRAADPLTGPHDDAGAALRLPRAGLPPLVLRGFRSWTTTLGMLYAWYPGRAGLEALLADDFVPDDREGPWV